jgi:hypothetical protein
VPRVATTLSTRDLFGAFGARTGFGRDKYIVTPGLYCTGAASKESPVLVTANYKLSFDALRKELSAVDAWLLVVDTRGINVWCAGGKGTFSAEEIAYQVTNTGLDKVVSHRELILPQLGANGVAAGKLQQLCGFRGRFGPILASMLPEYLTAGKANEKMRSVTFSFKERAILIPLELCLLWKALFALSILFFIVSGISPEVYSLGAAAERGMDLLFATLMAIMTGAVITPLLLPWIPFRQFWLKGLVMGSLGAGVFMVSGPQLSGVSESIAIVLWIGCCSSYLAMNFTGSTPFTSLSGVEKEMRKGLLFQIVSAAFVLLLWVGGPFV